VMSRTGTIEVSDFPERIRRSPVTAEQTAAHFISFSDQGVNLSREIEQLENRLIVDALRQANGITSKAAQLLQVNRTTLIEKMKRKGFASKAQGLRVSEHFSAA
jgi:two-component system, NtrC family, response regulator AtoC